MDIINILIVSASIGSGHTQAAKAVRDEITRFSPAPNITVVDFLDGKSSLGLLIKEAYLKMIDVFPNAYDLLYRWSQGPFPGTNVKNLTALLMKARMRQLIQDCHPDLIIFTHPFPCCAAAYLRRTQKLTTPLVAVITDFVAHQLWIHEEVDAYFVANQEIRVALSENGICPDRIFVTGIPISPMFGNTSRQRLRKQTDKPTVLIMGGGLGLGAVEQAVLSMTAMKTPCRIVVVTGNNTRLRERLLNIKSMSPHPLRVIGYTDRVHELMADASVLITKPGALTCSEALAMELPLLLYDPLPGQEEDNADYLTRQGTAIRIAVGKTLARTVDNLLNKAETLSAMQAKARFLGKPDAAAAIAALLFAKAAERQNISPAS